MRHVRMRGYAFEIDCARDGRTSGAPRSSARQKRRVPAVQILLKTSKSESREK